MRSAKILAVALMCLSLVIIPLSAVIAAPTNLILNPSVEIAGAANTPANWRADKWGTNTASHSYASTGYDGTKSLRIDMQAHTDGDAKWMSDTATISPNTEYTYSGYYKSNVATEIDLQYTDASGNLSYAYAQTVPASAEWSPLTAQFTAPADASKVVVMHVIASVGWLQTDEFSLVKTADIAAPDPTPPTETAGNLVRNPSFETGAVTPTNWTANKWGTNTATLTYANNGRTGTKSARIDMQAHTDGDAKWMADKVAVSAGTEYVYSDYYKSNVATELVLQYTSTSNQVSYAFVKTVPASADWTEVTTTFLPPANTAQVSVFHLIATPGWLQIDDASVSPVTTEPPIMTGGNQIKNPSVETAVGTMPADWYSNSWGTNNATFAYSSTDAHTGSRSLTTTISSYTSGDAKWYATPVGVNEDKYHTYSDFYKATVPTRVVVAFQNSAGTYTYTELTPAAASASWAKYQATFAIPAGSVKASVYHLLDRVGTLTIDDASLTVGDDTDPTQPGSILIPNASVEASTNGTAPDGWVSSSWGSNTASFQYQNYGHTGSKSVRVTVSSYVNGDAKWYFNPISSLQAGKQYRFSTWYRTNTKPQVVMYYQKQDGSVSYFGLPQPFPTTNSATTWTKYSDTFTVPEGTVGVSAFMFINSNGWVEVDDQSIEPYAPTGWSRPLVSLTFDDGYEDNVDNALPVMQQYGFKSTQCYETIDLQDNPTVDHESVRAFHNAGHEICSHTVTHPFLSRISSTQVTSELRNSQSYLQNIINGPIRNFASPYGDYNEVVNNEIKKYYRSHRTVDEGYNSKDNFNIYRLRVQNITPNTTISQYKAWIAKAKADKTWLIFVYHRIANDPGPYDSYVGQFQEQMQILNESGVTVKTMNDALDEVTAQ